jgi:hypothetical protein
MQLKQMEKEDGNNPIFELIENNGIQDDGVGEGENNPDPNRFEI